MGVCKVPKDNPGLSQGRPQRAASPSPTPCDLRYLIILTRPASPRLCQHKVKPAGNRRGNPRGREPRSCSRGCRSRWAGEAAAAAASAGSNTPSWSRCPGPCAFFAVHPGSPRALGAQLTHVPWPHVAAGFFQIRSQGAGGFSAMGSHPLKNGLGAGTCCCQDQGWSGRSRASLEQGMMTGRAGNLRPSARPETGTRVGMGRAAQGLRSHRNTARAPLPNAANRTHTESQNF